MRPGSRIDRTIQAGADAANMLRDIGDAMNASYIKAVAGVSLLIIEAVQIAKSNREKCIAMTEHVHELVCAIIQICGDSRSELSPAMLRSITALTGTLQKVLSYIRNQSGRNIMQRLVRHLEDASLLEECNSGLQHALGIFNVHSDVLAATTLAEFQSVEARRHQEILDLIIVKQQDDNQWPFPWERLKDSNSSISLLLPASPKIFHGRDEQLQRVIENFSSDQSFVAILGPGGVGKSSLALKVLHHPDTVDKFGTQRYWVPCDSANSVVDLIAVLATTFGLESQGRADKAIIRHLGRINAPILLVLDNMETPWEPPRSRPLVEEYLAQLAALSNISIMITMRGAERPAKIRWTRPFIPPLLPFDALAARETFLDISDVPEDDPKLDELLVLTDNLPLAVSLMASLAESEGCAGVLERWKNENVSLLSDGLDKRSNLEKSIMLSLLSPRMVSTPDARELLSVLASLPDGITDAMLEQIALPVKEISRCKTTLFRTSLAYVDHEGRLKVLAPIREYMSKTYPPSISSTQSLRKYFFDLVKLFEDFEKSPLSGLVQKIAVNLGNIRTTIQYALAEKGHDLKDALRCLYQLSRFTSMTDVGSFDLLKSVKGLVDSLDDDDMRGNYLLNLSNVTESDIPVEALRLEAIQCFERTKDISNQAWAYDQMSFYHLRSGTLQKAFEYAETSLSLAKQVQDFTRQSWALYRTGVIHYFRGEMRLALADAREGQSTAQAAGDMFMESLSLKQQAVYTIALGNYTNASALANQAGVLLDALGLDHTSSMYREVFEVRGEIHKLKTEYIDARKISQVLANISRHSGQACVWQGMAFCELAIIDLASSSPVLSVVRQNLETALEICLQQDYGFGLSLCDLIWAEYYCCTKELDRAEARCYQSLASVRGSYTDLTARCFERLGIIAMAKNDLPSALRHYVSYLALTQQAEDRLNRLQGLRRMADISLAQGDDATAATLLELTLMDFTNMDIHQARADCMFELGGIWKRRGDLVKAREYWEKAQPLFRRSSQDRSVELCRENVLIQ